MSHIPPIKHQKISSRIENKPKKGYYCEVRAVSVWGVRYYIIVDPNKKLAKVYELKDGRYIKIGDFEDEKATFKLEKYKKELEFNFGRIWD